MVPETEGECGFESPEELAAHSPSTHVRWCSLVQCGAPIDFWVLSANSQIDAEFVNRHLGRNWNWDVLSWRVTPTIVERFPDWPYQMKWLSCNPRIGLSTVRMFPHWDWNYDSIALHADTADRDFEMFMNMCSSDASRWHHLSSNKTLTWQYVERHLDKPWNWVELSRSILTPHLYETTNHNWNPIGIIQNPSFSIENCFHMALANKRLFFWLSAHPSLTCEFILQNPDAPWNWYAITPKFAYAELMDYLEKYPYRSWNWYILSKKIHWRSVCNRRRLPWSTRGLYENSHLEFGDVGDLHALTKKSKFVWKVLHWNSARAAREWIAALQLQLRLWKQCAFNPAYLFCQQRLIRQWESVMEESFPA